MAPVAVVSFGSISIHALRKESDLFYSIQRIVAVYFNPRSP